MGWMIIFAALTAIGFILALCCYNSEFATDLGIVLAVTGLACLSISGVIIGCVQLPAESDLRKAKYEKQVLEYRLETNDLEGNELLYSDILDFNKSLYTKKYYAHKFMTGWFVNGQIADSVDYISIGNGIVPGGFE